MYDILIVGAGPAGLCAAIYARRAGKSALILEKGSFGGQMTYSPKIENYPGFAALSGMELADKMVEQALNLGAEIEIETVTGIEDCGDHKKLLCEGGASYEGKTVIIATGAKHRLLGVPGEEALVGEGISFCAVCDGAFFEGKEVLVIGGGNSALQEAVLLSETSSKVTVVQNLDFLTGEQSLQDIRELIKLPGLDVEGIFTHFCVSDEDAPEHVEYTKLQRARFEKMIAAVEADGEFKFRIHHCCNAGASCSSPQYAWDMVRMGIIMYGTGDLAEKMDMKPVMTLKTTVSTIKEFDAESSISYGRTFSTKKPSRIGVVPIGYADGFFRALSSKFSLLSQDGPAPSAGRVCMDMTMIDLTDLPDVKVGDELEVYGENNLCNTAAKLCDTISYELLCAVSKRVPRYYLEGGEVVDYNLQLLY